ILREEIVSVPGVKSASLSYELPNGRVGFRNSFHKEGSSVEDAVPVKILQTDEYFAKTYQIEVLEGQYFHEEAGPFRANRIVLNESAVFALGYTELGKAIGEKVVFTGFETPVEIGGIV